MTRNHLLRLVLATALTTVLTAQTTLDFTDGQLFESNSTTTAGDPLTLSIVTGTATHSGIISGDGSLTKAGAGSVDLSGGNTYTGATVVNAGTLTVTGANASTGATQVATGATLVFGGGSVSTQASGITVADGFFHIREGAQVATAGNLTLTASATPFAEFTLLLQDSGSLTVAGLTSLAQGARMRVRNNNFDANGGITLADTSAFRVESGGRLNSATALTMADTALLRFASSSGHTLGSLAASGAARIELESTTLTVAGDGTFSGTSDLQATDSGNLTVQGNLTLAAGASDHVTVATTNSALVVEGDLQIGQNGRADVSITTGGLTVGGKLVLAENAGSIANLTANRGNLYVGGTDGITQGLGQASVTGNSWGIWVTGTALTSSVNIDTTDGLTIGTNSLGATFSGNFSGTGELVKADAGTLTLTGVNAYTGLTTVSGGTLTLAAGGTVAASSGFDIRNGATLDLTAKGGFTLGETKPLAGSGTVNVGVGNTLVVGGAFAPGGTSTGVMSITGDLTLAGTTTMLMHLWGLTRGDDYDGINVSGALVVGGTLSFDLGYTPALGDTFQLFNAASIGGTFAQVNLPTLATGLTWDTSNLLTNGTLAISAIPEPSAFALLAGLGGLGLAATRRRRRA